MISSFLHPERGYEKAQEQSNQYYNQGQNYLQPYNQQGQEAYGHVNNAMQNLMNPEQLQERFSNSYNTSPSAQYAMQEAQNNGLRGASSMGLMGSTPALQAIQAGTSRIGAEDKDSYIKNMIQQYMEGAHLAQGIYGQGANAAGQMGQNAMNMGTNSAENAYNQQNAPGALFSNLLGSAATMGSAYYGHQGGGGQGAPWNTMGGRGSPQMGTSPTRSPMYGGNY